MKRMSLRQFSRIVRRVLDALPPELHRHLDNVVVDVEDRPDAKTLRQVYSDQEITDGAGMYGLFSPLPLPSTEGMDFDEPPHRLIIYQRPLEEDFPDRDQLMIEIRKTVVHELAHHFGWTDDDLETFDETPDPFAARLLEKEAAMHLARLRLASLWLSQTARVMADNCLRMFVVLLAAGASARAAESAWYHVTPFFILPFVLLAPVNGAVANSLPRRAVLAGSSAWCMSVVLLLGVSLAPKPVAAWAWCIGLGLNMVGAVIYSPTRYAVLPAAAVDTGWSLPRVNGWIEMGGAAGVVAGLLLGVELHGITWPDDIPAAVALVVLLNLVALGAALPVHFPADEIRPEPLGRAVAGLFRDGKRIGQDAVARSSLVGLACLMALVVIGSGALLASRGALADDADEAMLAEMLALVAAGVAAGALTASWQWHPYRTLGLTAWGAVGLLAAFVWALVDADPRGPSLALGFCGGLASVPLRAVFQAAVPADMRGNAMAVSNTANYLLQITLAVGLLGLVQLGLLTPNGQLALLLVFAVVGAGVACWTLRRPAVEQAAEVLLSPCYRIRSTGPGIGAVPLDGPLLVIANHTAWLDPLWVGKVIPRRIIPMMTSDFYDLPVMRWLMKHLVGAIRVQAATFRREAPELREAVVALDRGECVVVFPEGRLRRTPELGVRNFGRGIWRILHERPQTPVVVLWIEGGWGSYTSYDRGTPTQNKRPDWWRPIDIAVSVPQVLDATLLADNRATRRYLAQACLNARSYLGLEVPGLADERHEDDKGEQAESIGEQRRGKLEE